MDSMRGIGLNVVDYCECNAVLLVSGARMSIDRKQRFMSLGIAVDSVLASHA